MGIFGRPKPKAAYDPNLWASTYIDTSKLPQSGTVTLPGAPPAGSVVTVTGVGGGGGGSIGYASSGYANGTMAYTVATGMAYQANAHATFSDDLTINRPGKSPIKVAETLDMILAQLLILQPNFEQMEKYPALKAAYDNYKLMEALCKEDNTKDNNV